MNPTTTNESFNRKYKILAKIGEGSYSEVLKCKNRENGSVFACKKLKHCYKSWNQVNDIPEIVTLRKLIRHPNILQMTEIHFDPNVGSVSLVFELMDMNLYELIKDRKRLLPEPRVKIMMFQLVRALRHLHKHGVFHRDIKPENILIRNDQLKLGDLGSVRGLYSRPPYTEYISTRWYRSPECLLTSGFYSYKMDIWAAGCVFFEILTLRPLFPGASELDQINKIHNIVGPPSQRVLQKFTRSCEEREHLHHSSHTKQKRLETIKRVLTDVKNKAFTDTEGKSRNFEWAIPTSEPTGLDKLVPTHVTPEARDLLKLMLSYDPDLRPTCHRILQNLYFQELREQISKKQETQAGVKEPIVTIVGADASANKSPTSLLDLGHLGDSKPKKRSSKVDQAIAQIKSSVKSVSVSTTQEKIKSQHVQQNDEAAEPKKVEPPSLQEPSKKIESEEAVQNNNSENKGKAAILGSLPSNSFSSTNSRVTRRSASPASIVAQKLGISLRKKEELLDVEERKFKKRAADLVSKSLISKPSGGGRLKVGIPGGGKVQHEPYESISKIPQKNELGTSKIHREKGSFAYGVTQIIPEKKKDPSFENVIRPYKEKGQASGRTSMTNNSSSRLQSYFPNGESRKSLHPYQTNSTKLKKLETFKRMLNDTKTKPITRGGSEWKSRFAWPFPNDGSSASRVTIPKNESQSRDLKRLAMGYEKPTHRMHQNSYYKELRNQLNRKQEALTGIKGPIKSSNSTYVSVDPSSSFKSIGDSKPMRRSLKIEPKRHQTLSNSKDISLSITQESIKEEAIKMIESRGIFARNGPLAKASSIRGGGGAQGQSTSFTSTKSVPPHVKRNSPASIAAQKLGLSLSKKNEDYLQGELQRKSRKHSVLPSGSLTPTSGLGSTRRSKEVAKKNIVELSETIRELLEKSGSKTTKKRNPNLSQSVSNERRLPQPRIVSEMNASPRDDHVFCSSDDDVIKSYREKFGSLISERASRRQAEILGFKEAQGQGGVQPDSDEDPKSFRSRHRPRRSINRRELEEITEEANGNKIDAERISIDTQKRNRMLSRLSDAKTSYEIDKQKSLITSTNSNKRDR